jgi:prophage regulatory protein
MRLIDWKVLKTMVPYSRQHIARLEADGRFPKRVQLGQCRVAWVLAEVEAWIEVRVAKRKTHRPAP